MISSPRPIDAGDLIAPLFVREGIDEPQPIASLPGVVQHTRASLRQEVRELAGLGVKAVVLFGVPAAKDAVGSGSCDPDGIVQLALRDLCDEVGDDVVLIADLCVDEYNDHGHCGIVDAAGRVDNDVTLEITQAAAQAAAGGDRGTERMMDGQVGYLRRTLDAAGYTDVAIMAYAGYASGLMARSAMRWTSRSLTATGGYQQDPRNRREAHREILADR